ncbi:MAG: ABC transporter permease [Chloroflexota bacterium]
MFSSKSLNLFIRLAWRHSWRRPLQSLFLVLGVAIGVAMIVAIDLANGSASRAFELGTESVAGRATHQVLGGPTGLDQQVYVDLRRQADFRQSAPVVEEYVTAIELDMQPMRVLGVDPFAESPFRSYLGTNDSQRGQEGGPLASADFLTGLMARPNTVLMSKTVADQYGLSVSDELTIRRSGTTQKLEIVGLLDPADELSRRGLDGLLLTDIGTAQEVLDKVGRLTRIDLIIPDGPEHDTQLAKVESILPPSARIERASARSGTVDEMTSAFRLNLTALSLLALVVGMFLIYNTVTFSVVQRRAILGSLRSLGVTRQEIFGLILGEAALLGLIGTLLGLGLGVLLGTGAVQLVTQTINDLFFVVAVREIEIPFFTLVKGTIIGILAALIGAAVPALEAMSVTPAGVMKRSNMEERMMKLMPLLAISGLGLLILGGGLLIPEWNLIVAFFGLFAIVVGCALLTPGLTLLFMRSISWLVDRVTVTRRSAGVLGRMAPRYITRALSRTSVAVAALMVAVSVIIGVGLMISSFRTTVELWLEDILQADIFITPAALNNSQDVRFDPEIYQQLATFDGVDHSATTRQVRVAAFLSGSDEGGQRGDATQVNLIALNSDVAGESRRYHSAVGDWEETWQAVQEGSIIINEPMAHRTELGVGDELLIQTDQGRKRFPIVGVSVSFDVNSTVIVHDAVYRKLWNDTEISGVALFVEPGVDVDEKVTEIRQVMAGKAELGVRSNKGLREEALIVFDRTFAITVALQLLATLVAFIGILSTLMSLQLERTREIGVLRANGMTRFQLWRLSLLETGLIGGTAGLIAIPTGLLLALVLIYIINLRSFGWTLEMRLQPQQFYQALGVAIFAALLAGIYPAWRMGQIEPARALRAE